MQTIDYIRRAEHCLNTGQPNLAMLYMGRARQANHEDRQENTRRHMRIVAAAAVQPFINAMIEAAREIMPSILRAVEDATSAMAGFAKSVEQAQARNQSVIRRQDHMKGHRP